MREFSIVIPLACRTDLQFRLFERLLTSIKRQSFADFEVIVSDDAPSEKSLNICSKYQQEINLQYVVHPYGPSNSSANTNYGMSKSRGRFIKVMHQDDHFFSDSALDIIHDATEADPDLRWGVVGFNHQKQGKDDYFDEIIPSLTTTLGCPSVSFFYSGGAPFIFFDESLVQINDHDLHQRLLWKFGNPLVVDQVLVSIGVNDDQVSASLAPEQSVLERLFLVARQRLFLLSSPEHYAALKELAESSSVPPHSNLTYVYRRDEKLEILGSGLNALE